MAKSKAHLRPKSLQFEILEDRIAMSVTVQQALDSEVFADVSWKKFGADLRVMYLSHLEEMQVTTPVEEPVEPVDPSVPASEDPSTSEVNNSETSEIVEPEPHWYEADLYQIAYFVSEGNVGVLINPTAGSMKQLRSDLNALGFVETGSTEMTLAGWLSLDKFDEVVELDSVLQITAASRPYVKTGSVDSEGDAATRADLARSDFGVDGTGVTVGIISDSFNSQNGYAVNVASGDLPSDVDIIQDATAQSDEGRAMAQIVYDLAPGADLQFFSAFNSPGVADQTIATAIYGLADAGSDIIVDDVGLLSQPFFQDGFAAQAVTEVVTDGVAYFSAAGNSGDDSYASAFNPGITATFGSGGTLHDFGTGQYYQQVTIYAGGVFRLSFQWDQPYGQIAPASGGSASDYDIYLLSSNDSSGIILAQATANNIGLDPVEILGVSNPTGVDIVAYIAITKYLGVDADYMQYVVVSGGQIDEFQTNSPTIYGQPNSAQAAAVAAIYWEDTPAFGTTPPGPPEPFTSVGGIPILFADDGTRLTSPVIRNPPSFAAPDGVSTTMSAFNPFFGTSAAAPHAAAVAALMINANETLRGSPVTIYSIMQSTAIDIAPAGRDNITGFGLIDAYAAVAATQGATPATTAGVALPPLEIPDAVNVVLTPTYLSFNIDASYAIFAIDVSHSMRDFASQDANYDGVVNGEDDLNHDGINGDLIDYTIGLLERSAAQGLLPAYVSFIVFARTSQSLSMSLAGDLFTSTSADTDANGVADWLDVLTSIRVGESGYFNEVTVENDRSYYHEAMQTISDVYQYGTNTLGIASDTIQASVFSDGSGRASTAAGANPNATVAEMPIELGVNMIMVGPYGSLAPSGASNDFTGYTGVGNTDLPDYLGLFITFAVVNNENLPLTNIPETAFNGGFPNYTTVLDPNTGRPVYTVAAGGTAEQINVSSEEPTEQTVSTRSRSSTSKSTTQKRTAETTPASSAPVTSTLTEEEVLDEILSEPLDSLLTYYPVEE